MTGPKIFAPNHHPVDNRAGSGTPREAGKKLWKAEAKSVFNLISIVITGFFVGLLAEILYPGPVDLGFVKTVLLGIGGSIVAGVFASRRSGSTFGEGVNRAGCLASVLGALLLIWLGRHW